MLKHGSIFVAGCVVALCALAVTAWAQDAPPQAKPPAEKAEKSDEAAPPAEKPAPETQPDDEEVRTSTPASADDVLRAFEDERPRVEPIKPAIEEEPTDPGAAPRRPSRARMPEGFLLVDRSGRLAQQGDDWQLVFVADNNPETAPEPPIRLLPNQMLERMIRETQGGARDVEFVVSGEVTDFMGENYLLLRKLMRRRDSGNLSK